MRTSGRLSAAIEILIDIDTRHRPAASALSDWGRGHRFAGSGDRSAIGNLVYDVLRKKASLGWRMGDDSPRAAALGLMRFGWGLSAEEVDALCDGEKFSPEKLSDVERKALEQDNLEAAPDWVRGDYPEFLASSFAASFGERAVDEGAALANRAPLDLRVNTLKSASAKVLKALQRFKAEAAPLSPLGVRIAPGEGASRSPNVQAEAGFQKGWFEVQDEGSQLVAMLTGAKPGAQVLDLCAGAGGKTLALAAIMENKGQIHAFDSDRHRLANIFDRLKRSGVRNAQVLSAGDQAALAKLEGIMDMVLIDAPCSGSGAWRRRPDAKWRLTQQTLDKRIEEQRQVLSQGAKHAKPGGRLVYITCSLLPQENQDQADWFLRENPDFSTVTPENLWQENMGDIPMPGHKAGSGLLLTPATSNTDGFFIAAFQLKQ